MFHDFQVIIFIDSIAQVRIIEQLAWTLMAVYVMLKCFIRESISFMVNSFITFIIQHRSSPRLKVHHLLYADIDFLIILNIQKLFLYLFDTIELEF